MKTSSFSLHWNNTQKLVESSSPQFVREGERNFLRREFSNGESPENLIFFLSLFPLAWHAAAAVVLGVMVDAEEANTFPNNENSSSCNAFV